MTVTKEDLAEGLHRALGLNRAEAKEFLDLFFEEIRGALERGEEVRLSAFGNFQLRQKKPRPGRNPKTGQDALVPARRIVVFRSGQKLRQRFNEPNTGNGK